MKSFFHCDRCNIDDSLIFDISSHCEACGIDYNLWCEKCERIIKELDLDELKNYIIELEQGMKIIK